MILNGVNGAAKSGTAATPVWVEVSFKVVN